MDPFCSKDHRTIYPDYSNLPLIQASKARRRQLRMSLLTNVFIVDVEFVIGSLADNGLLSTQDTSVTNWGQSWCIYTIIFAGSGPRDRLGLDLPPYHPPAIRSASSESGCLAEGKLAAKTSVCPSTSLLQGMYLYLKHTVLYIITLE